MKSIKKFLTWCWTWRLSILTVLAILVFAGTIAYYYFTTPSTTILISADDFPASLSPPLGFTPDALTDHIKAHLNDMVTIVDSGAPNELRMQEGLIRVPTSQTVPATALSSVPSPVFRQKWHGMDLNLARGLGMDLKAKRLLEVEVIGLPQGGWRLVATLKERPTYAPQSAGSAPSAGGKCLDLESCADDLAEQVLKVLNYRQLLNFYIKLNTADANRHILDLYQNTVPNTTIQPDDLVTWGNAFYALHRYDDALQKYQETLAKNDTYCPARIGRGQVYYYRRHGSQGGADLRRAEADFGSSCGENNKFAQTNLCSVLIREWRNGPKRDPRSNLLKRAQDRCAAALKIDSRFTRAAVSGAYILYRQGHYEKSLKYMDSLSQQYPTDDGLFATYGFLLYREYLRQQRADLLMQAIERTLQSWNLAKDNFATPSNLGAFYYEQRDYAKAVEYWQKAVLLEDGDADSRAGLALGLDKNSDPNGSFASFLEAVRLDTVYCRPESLKQKHDWSDQSVSDLITLIAKLPDNLKEEVHNLCSTTKKL
jgi:tetratricopeptide (TPR) repeat protein